MHVLVIFNHRINESMFPWLILSPNLGSSIVTGMDVRCQWPVIVRSISAEFENFYPQRSVVCWPHESGE